MASPFISRVDLGDYLGRDLTDDARALQAIDSACDMIRSATGQRIDRVENETILLDGNGTDTILLPELPVVSVSSVLVADQPYTWWVLTSEGVLRTKNGRWWLPGRGIVAVTYTHGYDEVPADLRMLALTLAARIYEQQLVKQESVGGYTATYSAEESLGFSKRERDIIAKYSPGRKPGVIIGMVT